MKTSGLRITICTLILSLLMLSGVWGQVTPNVPIIAIDPYISQAEYTGGVQVTVTFPSDPGAGDVRLYANGVFLTTTPVNAAQLTYVFTIDNSVYLNPPNGTYSITARHWDGLVESPDSPVLTIYIDRTAPTISALTIASSRGSVTIAADGDVITIALTSNEAIYALDITSVGTETPAGLTTPNATATYTATALPGGDIAFTGTFTDRAGNEVTFTNTNITDASYVCYARTMTWTGVSADWSNSGNWSWAGNASSEPPSEVDDCNIVSAGTPPVLGVGATVNSLTVTSGTLTLNAGLTVNGTLDNQSVIEITNGGSINKSDSDSGTFRYSTGGGTIPVLTGYNDLEVSASTWSTGGNLSVTGNLTVNGDLSSGTNALTVTGDTSGAGTWTAGTGTVTVGGDFGATAFSQAGGTLILNGTTAAFNPGGPLGSLQLNAGANVTLNADLTVATNITNGGILNIVGNALVSPTIGGAGTVNIANSGSITTAGTITTLNVSAGDSITLDGIGGLTITNAVQGSITTNGIVSLNGTGIGDLTVNGGSTLNMNGPLVATGTLSGAGIFTGGAAAIDIDGAVTVGTFNAATNTTSTIGGHFTPGAFTANGGTMIFGGTAGSSIAAGTFIYNNVEIIANKTTAGGTLNIDGTLTTAGGATLDLDTYDTTLDVAGITTNQGIITGGNAKMTFTDAVTNTGGTINAGEADVIFTSDFIGGTLVGHGTANPTIYFRGAATTVGTFTHTNDPVVFDGAGDQSFAPGGSPYAAVTVDKAAGTFTVNANTLSCTSLTLAGATPGAMTFNQDLTVTGSFTNVGGSFDVNLYGTTTQMLGAIFGTTGTVRLGNGGDTLTFDGGFTHTAGDTALYGTLETTNDDVIIDALALGGTSEIDTNTAGGNITINGAVTNTAAQALTLTAGAGDILLSNAVGTGTALGVLTLEAAGSITANSTIQAASVSIDGGAVDLNGNITAPGGFESEGTTFDNTNATITTTGTAITINHTGAITIGATLASGAGGIDIDSTGSTIDISATVTTNTGAITIDADGLTTITDAGDITTTTGSVTFGATGTGAISTEGEITTGGGDIIFTRAATITEAVILTTGATGGDITFSNTLNGVPGNTDSLTLTAGTGAVLFSNTVGAGESLGSLTVTSATGGITANNTIEALTVSLTGGAVDLDGAVTADNGFSSEGTTFDNNETITTTDTDITINHTGAITIGAALLANGAGDIDIDSTGSTIGIGATVTTSTGAITVDANGTTTVSAAIRATGAGTITFGATGTGPLTLSVADPTYVAQTTGGTITFNRPVTLTQNTLITTGGGAVGGDITFVAAASINGTFSLELEAGTGNAVLGSTVGTPVTPLTSLTVSSASLARLRDDITTNGVDGIDITATTINLDGLTMTANNAGAVINLNGNVTLTSGLASLIAIDDITVTGTVSGAQDLTVQTSPAATSAISFNGNVGTPPALTPLGAITIADGYNVTFNGSINAASITQTDGANTTIFTGAVTTTAAITITDANNITFSSTVSAASITQAAGSGTTTFTGNATTNGAAGIAITTSNITLDGLTMTAGTTAGADIALTGAVTLSSAAVEIVAQDTITVDGTVDGGQPFTVTSTNNAAIEFTNRIGETNELASLTINGGNITLNGIGDNLGSGVTFTIPGTGTISVTSTGFIALNADHYRSDRAQTWTATTGGVRYLATGNGTWNAGGTGITCPGTDVYLDHAGQTLTLGADLSCRSLYFYRGALSLPSRTIETTQHLVLFGSAYSANDPEWTGPNTRYGYYHATALAYYPPGASHGASTVSFDPAAFPATNFPPGALAGSILSVSGNFYVNGADMNVGAFTLNLPDNGNSNPLLNTAPTVSERQWGLPYAVAFNMTVQNSTATTGWVAASATAQAVTPIGTNTNWQFARPRIRAARTIFDNVILITFEDEAGNQINIENSSGQIAAAISAAAVALANGSAWYNGGALKFDGAFGNPECTAAPANDPTEFYLRHSAGSWNTDATGTSAGNAASTNRSGAIRTTVPDISFLKGLLYAADGKTMIRNYGAHTVPRFTATTDSCRPALVEVRTGQENHDNNPATQRPYDAHNFIELRYSEPVDIGDPVNGFNGGTEEMVYGIKYKKASESFNGTTDFGGAISGSGTLTVTGYATIAGTLATGSRGSYGVPPDPVASDPTVGALYRTFSIDGTSAAVDHDHRLRISIAGWAEETRVASGTAWKWFWPGYIDNAVTPSGTVTVPANPYIRDRAGTPNKLEPTINDDLAYGTVTYAKNPVNVNAGTPAPIHGLWDTSAPALAGLKAISDSWDGVPDTVEAIPTAAPSGLISRLELHFFDNGPAYSGADVWRWRSRAGWYDSDPNTIIHAAPESFGGSRPHTGSQPLPTGGGVRDSSLFNAIYGFTLRNDAETASAGSGLTGFVTNVNSVFFNLSAPLYHLDDPYAALTIDEGIRPWPIASAELEIAYTAYAPASPSGAFVTDLAGNRMKSTPGFLRCLDRTPPKVTISLAGVNRTDLLLLFSKNITGGTGAADGIRLDLANADGSITTITPTGISEREEAEQVLIFSLPQAVTASQLVNPLSTIRFITYGNVPNPDTGVSEPASAYSDFLGNYVSLGETHRLTDVGIGLIETLYASDGVNTDGVLGEEEGALRVFDGTGRLLDRNITVGTRIVTGESAPRPLSLYFDVAPPATALPELFNSAAAATSALWLPSVLPGFNKQGNTAARALGAEQILDENRTLRNFVIPEADTEVIPGSRVEMLYRYGDLFCARLADEADITSLAPWSFSISEMKKQRGGVTILNNVIDAHKREKAIIQVEVPTAGNLVIQVFTLDGNVVRVLERGRKGGGNYTYYWDGTNVGGRPVARGMYFVRIIGPDMDEIRKVMVIKE